MDTLPSYSLLYFTLLLLLSVFCCIVLPYLILSWRFLRNATPQDIKALIEESPTELIVGLFLGLIVIDALLYLVERPVLPKRVFYTAMGSIDLIVCCFIVYHLLNRVFIVIKQRTLSKQEQL
jgi:hypothetical protein